MSSRVTNLAIALVTGAALVTGFATFLFATEPGWIAVVLHGAVGLSLLPLAVPKWRIAQRGWRRSQSGRSRSVFLITAVLLTLASGIIQASGATSRIGPFTTMQIHVGAGLLTMSLLLIHMLDRPVSVRRLDLGRRDALRAAVIGAGGLAAWLVTEKSFDAIDVPGGNRRFTGSHEIADAGQIPVTQWLNDRVPPFDPNRIVTVDGIALEPSDLADAARTFEATLDCTSGWYSTQMWEGVSLDRLLDAGGWRSIVVYSITGYWRRFPAAHAGDLWLTTGLAGAPLSPGHGGPVRLVAPGRRGYWWVKWVTTVELDDEPPWWQPPLPTA